MVTNNLLYSNHLITRLITHFKRSWIFKESGFLKPADLTEVWSTSVNPWTLWDPRLRAKLTDKTKLDEEPLWPQQRCTCSTVSFTLRCALTRILLISVEKTSHLFPCHKPVRGTHQLPFLLLYFCALSAPPKSLRRLNKCRRGKLTA